MRTHLILGTLVATLAMPLAAQAQIVQGTVNGAQQGAAQGNDAAGPLGGIVGGVLGVDERPRFHEYVQEQNYPSYRYARPLRVGAVLPRGGVTYYEIPDDYQSAHGRYRYARINDRTVIVDPRTRRVVDIVD